MPLPCSQSFVESLQDLCDEHRNAVTPQELLLFNNRFHEYFFGLCENKTLVTEIAAHTRATHPIRSRGFFDANYIEIARSELVLSRLRSGLSVHLGSLSFEGQGAFTS